MISRLNASGKKNIVLVKLKTRAFPTTGLSLNSFLIWDPINFSGPGDIIDVSFSFSSFFFWSATFYLVLIGVDCVFIHLLPIDFFIFVPAKSISIEDSTVWTTTDKTFEAWICPLVYALISYCDDLILRLFLFLEKDLRFSTYFFKSHCLWMIYSVNNFYV